MEPAPGARSPGSCAILPSAASVSLALLPLPTAAGSWARGETGRGSNCGHPFPCLAAQGHPLTRAKNNRTGHGATDWCQIGKGVHQSCLLSPCLFNLYAEYIMQNARLDEAKAGINIARWNINNLRYADDTNFMAESKEEIKSLLMKVKEESEKAGLKFNVQEMKIMASSPITSWQIDGETVETVSDFYFLGLQNHCRWWLQPWN